jgi:hypothetical protein
MRGKIKPTSKIAGWQWCRSQMMQFKAEQGEREAKKSLSNFLYSIPPSAAHKWQKFIYSQAGWMVGYHKMQKGGNLNSTCSIAFLYSFTVVNFPLKCARLLSTHK